MPMIFTESMQDAWAAKDHGLSFLQIVQSVATFPFQNFLSEGEVWDKKNTAVLADPRWK